MVHWEGDIFDPFLSTNDLNDLKEKSLESSRLWKYDFNLYEYGLFYYYFPQFYHFPIVNWFVMKYSEFT